MKSAELIIDLLQQIYGALSFIAGLLVGVWIRKPSKKT
jgi:hypothetical protein